MEHFTGGWWTGGGVDCKRISNLVNCPLPSETKSGVMKYKMEKMGRENAKRCIGRNQRRAASQETAEKPVDALTTSTAASGRSASADGGGGEKFILSFV